MYDDAYLPNIDTTQLGDILARPYREELTQAELLCVIHNFGQDPDPYVLSRNYQATYPSNRFTWIMRGLSFRDRLLELTGCSEESQLLQLSVDKLCDLRNKLNPFDFQLADCIFEQLVIYEWARREFVRSEFDEGLAQGYNFYVQLFIQEILRNHDRSMKDDTSDRRIQEIVQENNGLIALRYPTRAVGLAIAVFSTVKSAEIAAFNRAVEEHDVFDSGRITKDFLELGREIAATLAQNYAFDKILNDWKVDKNKSRDIKANSDLLNRLSIARQKLADAGDMLHNLLERYKRTPRAVLATCAYVRSIADELVCNNGISLDDVDLSNLSSDDMRRVYDQSGLVGLFVLVAYSMDISNQHNLSVLCSTLAGEDR